MQEAAAERIDASLKAAIEQRTSDEIDDRATACDLNVTFPGLRLEMGSEKPNGINDGWVAERFKAPVLKTGKG